MRVVMALFAIASPHAWSFDPGAVWGGIWNFLSGITSDVKNFVLEAIAKAMDWVEDAINTVDDTYHFITNVLTEGLSWAGQQAANAAGAVTNVVEQTVQFVDGAFSNFRDQLKSFLEHAWDDLKAWVLDPAGDFLSGVLGDSLALLKKLEALGVDGLNFLISLALDPFGTIWQLIEQAVKDTVGAVAAPFDWIVQQGLDLLFAGFGDVVAVLKGAWHVLVWVADHAADLTEEALTASFGLGASVFDDQVIDTLTARSDDLESIVADWFA